MQNDILKWPTILLSSLSNWSCKLLFRVLRIEYRRIRQSVKLKRLIGVKKLKLFSRTIFICYLLMKSRGRRCRRQRRRRRRHDLDVYGERTWNANSFPRSFLFTKIVRLSTMDLSTTPRRTVEGVGELQKTRVAKSVFSIRSLVDVEETELPTQDDERPQSESLDSLLKFIIHRATIKTIIMS